MGVALQWMKLQRRRIAVFLLAAALLLVAWKLGAFDVLGSPEKVRERLAAWGPWAYVLFLATFVSLQPFGVPAIVWVLPAGLVWPFWVALPLSLVGIAGAASVGFFFARYLAREWVSARLPARLRRLDARVATNGLRSVILVRLVFHMPAPTHWVLGLSSLGYPTYVLGTVLGALPTVALVTWFGQDVVQWAEMHAALAAAVIAVIVMTAILARRLLGARRV